MTAPEHADRFPGLPEEVTYDDLLRCVAGGYAAPVRQQRDSLTMPTSERRQARHDHIIADEALEWLEDGEASEMALLGAFARAWLVAYCPADQFETLVAQARSGR